MFNSSEGSLESIFINDYAMIDQYAKTGSLWTSGYNGYGQLGNNTQDQQLIPIQTIAGGTNWKQVESGSYHTAAIKTNGELWIWGNNDHAQLGNNTQDQKLSPIQTVAGGTNWKQVSVNIYHSAAIKTNGELWTWGQNEYGSLGDNTGGVGVNKSSPVQTIASGTNWKQVSCGNLHTAAIKTNGELWTWGFNTHGQLGNNTGGNLTHKSSPVQTVAGGNIWKQVSASGDFTAAIKTNGELWTWGQNDYGQLGNSTVAKKSSPVQTVTGGTNWKQVSGGGSTCAAIKTDGTLWTWGYNAYGQLGNNTTNNTSIPYQTVAGGNNWKQVGGGSQHFMAIYFYDADNLYPGGY